jgi:hypothetical protein
MHQMVSNYDPNWLGDIVRLCCNFLWEEELRLDTWPIQHEAESEESQRHAN